MPTKYYERGEGPTFNEHVDLGIVVGELGQGNARLVMGQEIIDGTLSLHKTKTDGGRLTRTWVFDSVNGRFANIFVGEEGLTAGGTTHR